MRNNNMKKKNNKPKNNFTALIIGRYRIIWHAFFTFPQANQCNISVIYKRKKMISHNKLHDLLRAVSSSTNVINCRIFNWADQKCFNKPIIGGCEFRLKFKNSLKIKKYFAWKTRPSRSAPIGCVAFFFPQLRSKLFNFTFLCILTFSSLLSLFLSYFFFFMYNKKLIFSFHFPRRHREKENLAFFTCSPIFFFPYFFFFL